MVKGLPVDPIFPCSEELQVPCSGSWLVAEGPSRDVVINKHDVRHEGIVGIQVHEEEPKCSSGTKPWLNIPKRGVSDLSNKLVRTEGPKKSGHGSRRGGIGTG